MSELQSGENASKQSKFDDDVSETSSQRADDSTENESGQLAGPKPFNFLRLVPEQDEDQDPAESAWERAITADEYRFSVSEIVADPRFSVPGAAQRWISDDDYAALDRQDLSLLDCPTPFCCMSFSNTTSLKFHLENQICQPPVCALLSSMLNTVLMLG